MTFPSAASNLSVWGVIGFSFVGGIATSLDPCTLARTMILAGEVGADDRDSKARGIGLAALFVLGIGITYTALGLIGGLFAVWTSLADRLYLPLGLLVLVFGLAHAGVVDLPFLHSHGESRLPRIFGAKGSFMRVVALGSASALLGCPCCLSALLTIFAFTFARGDLANGVFGAFAFAFGTSLPLFFVGTFVGLVTRLNALRRYSHHMDVVAGTVLVMAGALLVWIA